MSFSAFIIAALHFNIAMLTTVKMNGVTVLLRY
jgi:hypothetical protein